jgi:SAM-dependent methyltransferase
MDRKTQLQVIDDVFYFLPKPLQWLGRMLGLYDKIINGTIKDAGDFYEHLPELLLRFQDPDYSQLADAMLPHLNTGTTVEIGCGRGDLMMRLALRGIKPIYGIDRIAGMVKAARKRLKKIEHTQVFHQRAERFDFSTLSPISNAIINNSWEIFPPDDSRDLLVRLKDSLEASGRVIIGNLSRPRPDYVVQASQRAQDELGFYLRYPQFLDFEACGYRSETVNLDGGEYAILTPAQKGTGRD